MGPGSMLAPTQYAGYAESPQHVMPSRPGKICSPIRQISRHVLFPNCDKRVGGLSCLECKFLEARCVLIGKHAGSLPSPRLAPSNNTETQKPPKPGALNTALAQGAGSRLEQHNWALVLRMALRRLYISPEPLLKTPISWS